MLYKYKGRLKDGSRKVGYVNADNYNEALKLVDEEVLFIEYVGRRVDNKYVNQIRQRVDKQTESLSKIGLKRNTKERKNKKKNFDLKSLIPQSKKNTQVAQVDEADLLSKMKKLATMELNQTNSLEEDFEFRIENESGRNQVFRSNSAVNMVQQAELPKDNVVSEKDKLGLDWSLMQKRDKSAKYNKLRIRKKHIIMFTRELQIMITSGVPLTQSLQGLQRNAPKNLAKLLDEVISDIQQGSMFSQALAKYPKHFNNNYVALVSVGESTGEMSKCLEDVLELLEQQDKVRNNIITSSIYPVILVLFSFVFLFVISKYFVPLFQDLLLESDAQLNPLTLAVFFVAERVTYVFGVFVAITSLLVLLFAKNENFRRFVIAKSNSFALKAPVLSKLVKASYMYSFSSTIALMLDNGIRLKDTLMLASNSINNIYIKNEIANAMSMMYEGHSFSSSIEKQKNFDKILVNIIATGEATGELAFALKQVSNYYKEDVNRKSANFMEVMKPLSMIVVGIFVAPLIIGLALPILDMSSGAFLN